MLLPSGIFDFEIVPFQQKKMTFSAGALSVSIKKKKMVSESVLHAKMTVHLNAIFTDKQIYIYLKSIYI